MIAVCLGNFTINKIIIRLWRVNTFIFHWSYSWLLYLVQNSVETTDYTISGHCSYRPANIGFTRDLVLPQRWRCRVQYSGIWLRIDRLESTNLWENINVFVCCISSVRKQPMYLLTCTSGDCPFNLHAAVLSSSIKAKHSTVQSRSLPWKSYKHCRIFCTGVLISP